MSVPVPPDETLRGFLLGTLTADQTDRVRAWLDADPARAAHLDRLSVRDPLTDAVADATADEPVAAEVIERVIRGVSDSLNTRPPGTGDTPSPTEDGATVSQARTSAPAHAHGWPPARLGGYRVVRELGHGGMGYVFEAEDETLARRVAIKVLTPDLAKSADAAARFLREARHAAAVEHDNVVPVLHVGEEAGAPYIVMPLLQGESLADRLKRTGKLSVAEAERVGRDIASGLAAAHAKGLVHRDLKPANVWLDAGTGRARVLDFGLARQGDGADALTQAGSLVGTPAYMSPEQLDGQPASPRSDLFALGAVLYECVTGTRAFNGPTISAILKAVSDHNPPAPGEVNPEVPAALSVLIVRLLAKSPAARPGTATEVLAALARGPSVPVAEGASTVTWPEGEAREQPASRKTRLPRQLQIGCVVTVSLGALLIGFFVIQSVRSARELAQRSNTPGDSSSIELRSGPPVKTPDVQPPPLPARYRGKVDVRIARTAAGREQLLRLNEPDALPLKRSDPFVIEVEIDPPAYVYVVWVDPGHDVTPVYPWNPKVGWGSRPAKEEPVSRLMLPPDAANRYRAPDAQPGVATMVMFARPTPLDVPDDAVEKWFTALPELPLPPKGDTGAVWFDNYTQVRADLSRGKFGEVASEDVFAQWQGQLQKALGDKAQFQTAVSFARTGRK